jgi:dihydrolipoamide dehydrogenase
MQSHYDVLIIGGGPGGTPTAMALASAGKQVLLVESGDGLGGTCLFEGCIPSKIMRESARRLRELREAADFGLCLPTQDVRLDWSVIQGRKRTILQRRSQAAKAHLQQFPSLNFLHGSAQLLGPRQAQINLADGKSKQVDFEHAIIATGSVPFLPPVHGIDHPCVLDNQSILAIDHVPDDLTIIGAGPIGVELAQIFHTFGTKVTMLEAAPGILGPVDQELAGQLRRRMEADGIEVHTDCHVSAINHSDQNVFVEFTPAGQDQQQHFTDNVLVAVGRRPNITGLGIENTAVEHDAHGIKVDATLQTAEPGIYAVGDVIGQPMFAHWATAQGLALARHLLGQPVPFPDRATNTAVIFSEPELAMAGLTETQAVAAGLDIGVARYDFKQDARAQIAGRDSGLLKIVFDKSSQKVVGVHALVEGAGDLMGEAALLVKAGLPIQAIAGAIHPHPTLTESYVQAIRAVLASHGSRREH